MEQELIPCRLYQYISKNTAHDKQASWYSQPFNVSKYTHGRVAEEIKLHKVCHTLLYDYFNIHYIYIYI